MEPEARRDLDASRSPSRALTRNQKSEMGIAAAHEFLLPDKVSRSESVEVGLKPQPLLHHRGVDLAPVEPQVGEEATPAQLAVVVADA